jgi:cytochrome c biogenesis protein CcmG/thiol:disulfide interchange protein DsbE
VGVGIYSSRHSQGSQPDSAVAKQHRPAPDFNLPLIDGGELKLSSYRGKVVLLDFWATWCVPCREETPHFVELQQKYGGEGLQIIGVSMDDSTDPVTFYQQFHINYPLLMGTADVGSAYGGVLGLPIAFLIDRDGRIYAKHMGATDAAVFEKDITTLLQTR